MGWAYGKYEKFVQNVESKAYMKPRGGWTDNIKMEVYYVNKI